MLLGSMLFIDMLCMFRFHFVVGFFSTDFHFYVQVRCRLHWILLYFMISILLYDLQIDYAAYQPNPGSI